MITIDLFLNPSGHHKGVNARVLPMLGQKGIQFRQGAWEAQSRLGKITGRVSRQGGGL